MTTCMCVPRCHVLTVNVHWLRSLTPSSTWVTPVSCTSSFSLFFLGAPVFSWSSTPFHLSLQLIFLSFELDSATHSCSGRPSSFSGSAWQHFPNSLLLEPCCHSMILWSYDHFPKGPDSSSCRAPAELSSVQFSLAPSWALSWSSSPSGQHFLRRRKLNYNYLPMD